MTRPYIVVLSLPRTASSSVLRSLRAAGGAAQPEVQRIHYFEGSAERPRPRKPTKQAAWEPREERERAARDILRGSERDRTVVVIRRDEAERAESMIWYTSHRAIERLYRPETDDFESGLHDVVAPVLARIEYELAVRVAHIWTPLGLPDLDFGAAPPIGAFINGIRVCVLRHAELERDFSVMTAIAHGAGVLARSDRPLLRLNASEERGPPAALAAFRRWLRAARENTGAASSSWC